MYTYTWCESEDRELLERVSAYINRELTVFNYHKTKVVESPTIMNPYSWSKLRTLGEVSWEHIGQWTIQACFPYELGSTMRDKISNCISDYKVGWRECMAQWNATIDAQEKRFEEIRLAKVKKDLWKASFDPKQCTECRFRVDCLTINIKQLFEEDRYHYHRKLECVFEARFDHWNHKGQSVVEVYGRDGKWHEATRYYRSINSNIWFTFNPRILEEMRRTITYSERGYHVTPQRVGINFAWLGDPDKNKK